MPRTKAATSLSAAPAAPAVRRMDSPRTMAHVVPAGPAVPAAASRFDYQAVTNKGRRAPYKTLRVAESVVLPSHKRAALAATATDEIRNNPLVAWAVRRYVDYVASARLQINTDRERLAALLERLFSWHASPLRFDVARRMGREETFRLFEVEKLIAGDAALILLSDGTTQRLESDLIAKPKLGRIKPDGKGYEPLDEDLLRQITDDGVVLADWAGRVKSYCICNRGLDGKHLAFDHLEDAENVIFSAYYTRYGSQLRGVSPLAPAINPAKDLAETLEWTRLKTKIHALFGVALTRDDLSGATTPAEQAAVFGEAAGLFSPPAPPANAEAAAAADLSGTDTIRSGLQDLNPDSMLLLDMQRGDKIDTIESKTPSAEFREFSELLVRHILLALGIPYTAYNSAGSSFSGIKADANAFERTCEPARKANRWARKAYSDWLVARAWNSPDWKLAELARAEGVTRLRDCQEMVEWVSEGSPWLEKLQEVEGDIKAIGAGLDNPIDAARRRGADAFANLEKTARVYERARELGVPITFGDSGQASVEEQRTIENETEQGN